MQEAKRKRRNKALGTFVMLILVISTIGIFTTFPRPANAASLNGGDASTNHGVQNDAPGGTGATLPYVEMEAHTALTNGTIIGPSYTLGNLAFDAVDHQAVLLNGQGQYVQFTLKQQANSINARYSIPDAAAGGGINASLSIYINGVKQTNDLQLTSKYSWVYGPPNFSNCTETDWSNTPGGTPSHQFDEMHVLLPQMAAGTTVKLQVDSENTADGGNPISNVAMNGVNISGAEFAFSNKVSTITGSASNVTASGLTVGGMESCESPGSWNVTMGSGTSGWSPTPQTCGFPS